MILAYCWRENQEMFHQYADARLGKGHYVWAGQTALVSALALLLLSIRFGPIGIIMPSFLAVPAFNMITINSRLFESVSERFVYVPRELMIAGRPIPERMIDAFPEPDEDDDEYNGLEEPPIMDSPIRIITNHPGKIKDFKTPYDPDEKSLG
jgi:hypothetical protein